MTRGAPPPSREAVLDRLFDLFHHDGLEGASISDISAATGLGKSSLYRYFPGGKTEMAEAVLERAGVRLRERVIAALLSADASRRARVDAMLAALSELCRGTKPRILAGGLPSFGTEVQDIFRRWQQALTRALAETGSLRHRAKAQATSAIVQIEGALILARVLGDPAVFRRTLKSVRALLLD